MTLSDFASRLEGSRRKTFKTGDEGYIARCPNASAHSNGDRSLSFAVWWGQDDWLHVRCQKGCTEDEIMGAMGLAQKDRKVGGSKTFTGPDAVYEYRDGQGAPYFEKHRFQITPTKKDFRIRARMPDGSLSYNVQHLDGWAKTLYCLKAVKEAVTSGRTIYVNEGEKACDLMSKMGMVATCQPLGADKGNPGSKWLQAHTDHLQGAKEVVVVADRDGDGTGEAYARYVASQLRPCVGKVSVVASKTDGEKDDAYDHFKAGFTEADLIPLKEKKSGLGLRSFVGVERKAVDWLWAPYLEVGSCALLAGDPGVGKSYISLAIAAGITHGAGPPGFPRQEPGDVVLCCTEDEAETVIAPRLDLLGADCSRIFEVIDHGSGRRLQPPMTPEKMLTVIETVKSLPNPRLAVFDPIVEWFPPGRNMNAANEAREVTRLFRLLGEECRVCSLIIGHPNKTQGPLLYRFSGSIDFTAVVRSALFAAVEGETEMRHIVHAKTNHGRKGKAVGYEINDEGRLLWAGVSDITEEQLMNPVVQRETKRQVDAAREWIKETLGNGPMLSDDLFAGAKAAGFSKSTCYRAKEGLGLRIRPSSAGGKWEWSLRDEAPWWNREEDPFAD